MNLEDYLSKEDKEACGAIMSADTAIFSELVTVSGLSKTTDFRNMNLRGVDFRRSDLRGFDFTGADLRECIKDQTTLFDETTILDGAQVDWVEEEFIPIVDAMRAVEGARKSEDRRRLLTNLFENYDSPIHLKRFIGMSIESTNSVEAIVDFSSFLDVQNEDDQTFLLKQMSRVFMRNINLKRGRALRGADLKVAEIVDKMKGSRAEFLLSVADDFEGQKGSSIERLRKALEPRQARLF